MKKSVVIILFLSTAVTSLVTAQKTALEYLKTVPGNPDSVCVCLKEVRQNYETAVSELYDIVKEDIQSRTRAVEDYMNQNQDRMKASMMKEMSEKTGMSQQELEDVANTYKRVAGFQVDALNAKPPIVPKPETSFLSSAG